MNKLLTKNIFRVSILLFFCNNAFAYLDPGTISIVIQGIIAGILGFFAFFSNKLSQLKKIIKKIFKIK